jgi:Flp pilus assembly protein TadB
LTRAAYHINPNLVNRLASGWQFQSYLGIQWQEDIEKLNKTLTFRKGMRKAILETSKKKRP